MKPDEIVAVLTAAGRSTRMGRLKALLEWQGQPLITHQVRALLGCREVIVVLGHEAKQLEPFVPTHPRVRIVFNPRFDEGRSSSLAAAFALVRPSVRAMLVAAVDQPIVEGILTRLCEAYQPDLDILQPQYDGQHGHPVLFRGSLLPELQAVAGEPEGLRSIVSRHGERRGLVPVSWPEVLLDLNTPADLVRA